MIGFPTTQSVERLNSLTPGEITRLIGVTYKHGDEDNFLYFKYFRKYLKNHIHKKDLYIFFHFVGVNL